MTAPKVCILAAGKGTRLGELGKTLNKALLPLGNRAVISHIIEKFPRDTEFVVALGDRAGQVRNYLAMAHPDHRFTFCQVENFEGPGSGPGHSLWCCRTHLEGPFVIAACDTLWRGPLEFSQGENWVGVARIPEFRSHEFCNFKIDHGLVTHIVDKERAQGDDFRASVALFGVKKYAEFFSGLECARNIAGEVQLSAGLEALMGRGIPIRAVEIDWIDTGNERSYRDAVREFDQFDYSKPGEALYILEGRVIKYSVDRERAQSKVQRARLRPDVFPEVSSERAGFFSYPYVEGTTLYQHADPALVSDALLWLDRGLWKDVKVKRSDMASACDEFYREKTIDRLSMYWSTVRSEDAYSVINGEHVCSTTALLHDVPWRRLAQGIPAFIHGDLHFDHIIHNGETGAFTLIDWRSDFAGRSEWGDLSYDIAKLAAGTVLDLSMVRQHRFGFQERGDETLVAPISVPRASEYLELIRSCAELRGVEWGRVEFLVPLIYLNMAPLHREPFSRFLYSLGRLLLKRAIEGRPPAPFELDQALRDLASAGPETQRITKKMVVTPTGVEPVSPA